MSAVPAQVLENGQCREPSSAGRASAVPSRLSATSFKAETKTESANQVAATKIILNILGIANSDPTGLLGMIVVFAIAAVLCWIVWTPFSWPGRILESLISPGNCALLQPGTFSMYVCSAKIGGETLVGPLVVLVILYLLRRQLVNALRKLAERLPNESNFLIAPVIASLSFSLCWAPIHYQIVDASGFVSQKTFPAVVAVFTFASLRYTSRVQRVLSARGFFEWRDKIPSILRIILASLVPLVVSLAITYQQVVTNAARKEQIVVLIALCAGYLAITPRQGSILSGLRVIVAPPEV